MSGEAASRQEERKKKPLQIFKALGIGIAEGVVITGLTILLMLIHDYAIFASLVLWLVAGWISTYFIKVNTLEIILVSLSGNLVSGLIFFVYNVDYWVIALIFGLAILFWIISFMTKVFLLPKAQEKEKEELT
ncbi:MAG: hypothetical protein ACTSPK_07025 [Candidatus Heimdallarchaeota archaeon]